MGEGLSPALLAALITQVGIPELVRWLKSLHDEDEVVTEEAALEKLGLDVESANQVGEDFLNSHPAAE